MRKYNEHDVIKKLRNYYGKDNVIRLNGLAIRGVPDVLISDDGDAFFLEIKIDKTRLTAPQHLFLMRFKKNSGVLHVYNEDVTATLSYSGCNKFKNVIEAFK